MHEIPLAYNKENVVFGKEALSSDKFSNACENVILFFKCGAKDLRQSAMDSTDDVNLINCSPSKILAQILTINS